MVKRKGNRIENKKKWSQSDPELAKLRLFCPRKTTVCNLMMHQVLLVLELIAYPEISYIHPGKVQAMHDLIAVGFWDKVCAIYGLLEKDEPTANGRIR